jgi:hypothetical protein
VTSRERTLDATAADDMTMMMIAAETNLGALLQRSDADGSGDRLVSHRCDLPSHGDGSKVRKQTCVGVIVEISRVVPVPKVFGPAYYVRV